MNLARLTINNAIERSEALANVNHCLWAKRNFEVWFGERRPSHVQAVPSSTVGAPDDDSTGKPNLLRRRSTIQRQSGSFFPQSADSREGVDMKRRRSAAWWLQQQRLSRSNESTELQDHWLRSADTTFPHWYILSQIKREARMLLYFSLPQPHWFAARLF